MSDKFPNAVVLRANQLWLEAADPGIVRFFLNYLDRPQWKGRSWEEICLQAELPEPPNALAAFFAEEAQIVKEINTTLDEVESADLALDNQILDLYGIVDSADRRRILGSAPISSDGDSEGDDLTKLEAE